MVEETIRQFGRIDILFNNTGIAHSPLPIQDLTIEDWDKVINVNLKGVWLGCEYAIPYMKDGGGGVILNTSSAAGYVGFTNYSLYVASKGGVIALTKALALECADHKIRVNTIVPALLTHQ